MEYINGIFQHEVRIDKVKIYLKVLRSVIVISVERHIEIIKNKKYF